MNKTLKILLITLGLFGTAGCSDAANNFETYSITTSGKLDWNDIKEANYYQVKYGKNEYWTEKSEYDLSSLEIDDLSVTSVTVKAFVSKAYVGQMDVSPLDIDVTKIKGSFYVVDNIQKYNVTINYQQGYKSQTINDKWKISLVDIPNPTLINSTARNIYNIDGYYLDSKYTKKIDYNYVSIEADTTIYAKVSKKTKEISFEVYNYEEREAKLLKKTNLELDQTFKLSSYESNLPTIEGSKFFGWKTSTSIYSDYLDNNEQISVMDAESTYYAIYHEDVNVYVTSGPYINSTIYGKITLHYGDELTEQMIKKYDNNTYSGYKYLSSLQDDPLLISIYSNIIRLPYSVTSDIYVYGYKSSL